jgi:hypothetical protein
MGLPVVFPVGLRLEVKTTKDYARIALLLFSTMVKETLLLP